MSYLAKKLAWITSCISCNGAEKYQGQTHNNPYSCDFRLLQNKIQLVVYHINLWTLLSILPFLY